MVLRSLMIVVLSSAASGSQAPQCGPGPAIRAEILNAAARRPTDSAAFDENVSPFLTLRRRHPDDLFVHESYQDAVQQYGIEGHLRMLTQEYQAISLEHPGDVTYRYLAARALIGRATTSAIQNLTQLLAENPDFAPAHRSLAEIYGSEMFRDRDKETTEREEFLALCPGSEIAHRPAPLPPPSSRLDDAERLVAQNGDPDLARDMLLRALRDDEWRLQRIRPFDWYSVDYKRENQGALRSKYWRGWAIQVRCYRLAQMPEQAAELMRAMERRASTLNSSDPVYWDALATLARLYAEGNQKDLASQKLDLMGQFLNSHPNTDHAGQLAELKKLIAPPGG